MNKSALIFGVNGQDGSYLAELLLKQGWKVYGVVRRTSTDNNWRLEQALKSKDFTLISGDVTDISSVIHCFHIAKPSHIYNLAAQSHVGTSFSEPKLTTDVTYLGVLNILEVARMYQLENTQRLRIYQASSSEMFGSNYTMKTTFHDAVGVLQNDSPDGKHKAGSIIYQDQKGELTFEQSFETERYQNEGTPFFPCSPYGVAKLAAHQLCRVYRQSYGLDVRCGILFNHESPRRGNNFVTKKVTSYIGGLLDYTYKKSITVAKPQYCTLGEVVAVSVNEYPMLQLGNCDAVRDWGHAKDYVDAMYKIMIKDDLSDDDKDLVVGTGESHTIREFVKQAFSIADIDYTKHVQFNTKENMRPYDVEYLRADATKMKKLTGWSPTISFTELVREMVNYELKE